MSRKSNVFKAITGKNYDDFDYNNLNVNKQKKKQNTSGLIKNAKGDFLDQFLGTTGDILADVGEGILGFGEGIADTLTYGASDIVGIFNKDLAEGMRENAKFNSTEALFGKDKNKNMFGNWRNDLDEYSRSGDFSDMVFKGIGTTAGAVGTAGLGAGAGVWTQTSNAATFIPMFTSSYGNAKSEALNNGADNFNATVSALKSGTIDGFTELMFGALPGLNKGSKLGNTITDAVGKGAEKAFGKTAGRIAVGLTKTMGEGAEEVFGNIFNAQANDILNFITNGKYNYGMENQTGNIFKDTMNVLSDAETWKEFLSASLSAAITQSGTKIFTKTQTNKVIKEYAKDHNIGFNEAKEKLENYSNIFEDITNKKLGYTEALENKEESKAKALNLMKSQYLNNIENQINETADKAINSLNERIEQAKAELKQIDEEGVLDANDPDVQKMVLSKYNLNSLDSLSEKEIKQYKDSLREKYVDRLENPDKYTKYQYEETDNERTNKIYQSADKANIDNTKESRDFVDKMVRVANDLKTDVLFTNNEELKANPNIDLEAITQDLIQEEQTKKGSELTEKEIEEIKNRVLSEIGGYYNSKTGTIYINADNKTEGAKFIFGHELMHRLEQNKVQEELRKAIFEHAKTKGIYDTERSTLEKLYKGVTKDIDSELVANLLGKLYQDESFVKDLAVKKPNIFTQIFSKLKEMYYKATGQQEKAELEKIVRLYQKVYNEVKNENIESKEGTKLGLFDRFKKEKYEVIDPKNIEKIGYSDGLVKEIQRKTRNNLKDSENVTYISPETIKDYLETGGAREIGTTEELISKIRNNGITSPIEIVKTDDGYKIKNGNHRLYIALKMGLNEVPVEYNESIANLVDKEYNELYESNENEKNSPIIEEEQYNTGNNKNGELVISKEGNRNTDATNDRLPYGRNRVRKGLAYQGNDSNNIGTKEEVEDTSFSNDIKYSLSKDNEGRELSKQQQEYFKDSKVRDKDGNLEVVYHGSNKAGFTTFSRNYNFYTNKKDVSQTYTGSSEIVDTKKLESIFDAKSWLKGITDEFYIEDNKVYDYDGEKILEYKNTDELLKNLKRNIQEEIGNTEAGGIYEGYLNITNPLIVNCNGDKWSGIDINGIEDNIDSIFEEFGASTFKENGAIRTSTNDIASAVSEAVDIGALDYDGIIFKNIIDEGMYSSNSKGNNTSDVYVTFNSNQFKALDNSTPSKDSDIRYSLSKDNQGNEVSPGMQKYMADSKARIDEDLNEPLVKVYHTTTDKVPQFNIFDPTGTDYYKFGNQVVNYYTDDKTMSGSYADQHYKMADTRKLNSIEDVNNYLKEFNESFNTLENPSGNAAYAVKEENGKYNVYNEVENDIIDSAKEFINTLNEEQKEFIKKYLQDGASKVLFEDRYGLTSEQEGYIKQYEDWAFNQYTPKSLNHAPQNYLAMLLMDTYTNRPIATYDSKEQLFRNLKTDLEIDNYDKRSKLQYAGYVNITNPYIIDAEGRTWNKVESKADSDITKELLKVNNEDRQYLERLASDSIKTYNDNLFNYQQAERAINDFAVDRTNTTLEQRLIHRTIHDLGFEDFMKVLNNDKNVYWGRKEQFMDDAFNNGFATLKQKEEYRKTGNIPEEVLNKVNKLIHEPAKYEDRFAKKELEVMGMKPDVKETTIYDLWNNQDKTYKTFDEGGRYEYSKFNDQVNEKNLYRAIDNEILFKVAKRGFNDDNIRLLYNDWSVTNDIVKSIINLNKVGENYDGLIIKNVVDYGGDSETHEPHNLYITFASEQFKSADNENPTDDPDIRYSMGNNPGTITPNDMVVKEINEELPLPMKKQDNLPFVDKKEEKTTEDKRLQNKINKESEKAIKIATKDMELNRQELKQLRQDLEKYKGKTREELTNAETFNDIYDIVSNYANRNYIQTDEELKTVQNEIRKTRIRVPEELKKQITDYNYFRKQNMGRLMLSNSGQSIDSVYEELSNSYPGYFKDATTEADMLYELADFMNKDANTIMEYQLTDTELNNQATKIFNKLVTNTLNENDINEIQEKLSKKKISRKDVRNILLDEMGITAEDLQAGKDINPINYTRTDPIRVNEKVFGNEIGNKINDATINVTKHNEAERTRFLNQERDEIKDLGIKARSKESAAVQKYGEKYYINEQGEKVPYGDRELASEFKDAKTQEKIKKAAEVIRSKYDRYIDSVNKVLDEMGYNIIPKRNDYMHHFQELTDTFSKWGTPFNPQSMSDDLLPTDINGLTEFNRPGKNWFSAAQQRMGEKTTYDAITGIDQYLEGVSNLIYHTGDIQRYRALEELVRNTYGQEHGLENAEGLTEEEFNQRVADIQANKLSGYASWLNEQANTLANKKSTIDRGFEKTFGRKVYNAMNTLKTQVGSNMTGFNVRSALTNFISTTLAASKTNKLAMVKGTVQTINNIFHKDNFIDKSDFLTSRFGSDVLSKKGWQKLANAGQIFMSGTDWFTSNVIVRSKYYEGLAKGMTEEQAIKYADDFGFRVMGDRSKGSTANAFNSKTLGLLTQFQLEVNNQWDFMLHDSKRDYNLAEDKSKATAGILFQMGQLAAYSYLANELFDKFTGSRVTFDPIEIFKKLFGLDDDDKDKSVEERMTEASQLLIDSLPFVSTFTGGRIPLSSALPNMEELITGKDKNGNEKSRLDTLKEPLPYLLMPTGYSQLNKTKGALEMYDSSLPVAGSYTDSGNLRFTTKTDAASTARNLLFGKWSSEEAQDYLDSGYKTIPKSKIQEMIDLNMDSTEYRAYRENLNKAIKTTNDEGYTKYIDNNNNTYWYDKETGNLYDDNGKLSDKNVMSLNKANKSQATADYINSLPYTKEQKNIMLNNALGKSDTITDQYGYEKYKDSNGNVYWLDSKNDILYDKNYNEINDNRLRNEKFINGLQKVSNEVNISDYNKYGDYEEYQYAISNPERYSTISQITDYKTYQTYADEIESIKSKYQTTDNMTTKQKQYISKQRKQAVFDYINDLNLSKAKKLMLYRLAGGYSINNYKTQMFNYIDSLKLSKKEKETIYKELF